MSHDPERDINQAAYRRLRDAIKQTYPAGHFVAISGGQIVANAGTFEELQTAVTGLGKDLTQVLVAQAGVEDPESVVILGQDVRP